jgi:hypothetical protein
MTRYRDRERLAWVILILCFASCIALAAGIPLGVRYFIRNARVRQEIVVEPQRGTPSMQRGSVGPIEAVIGPTGNIHPDTIVTTDQLAQGALTLYAPGGEEAVSAVVQIYNETDVTFVNARSPRFEASHLPHDATIEIEAGRVRITVNPAHGRPTVVVVQTPHANATLEEGSYEVRVNSAFSEFAARDGRATIRTENETSVILGPSERTIARPGATTLSVLEGERNLLRNGDFDQSFEENHWVRYWKDVQREPGGTVIATTYGGRSAARFQRLQENLGHTEIGIQQDINYDVQDFSSLVLHLNVLVLYQSLPGCGSVGSECPIIVRIDYKDVDGTDREWHHGFYSTEPAETDLLQPWEDEQIPYQTWYTFDSGNLVAALERPPALIKEITIYASGHAFDVLVAEVELLAQE